jgi:chromosome segregation ATPase
METMLTYLLPLVTALGGLFSGKFLSKRERKKSDLQLINEAISPLITSISQLTEQNNEVVGKLLDEQDKNLKLLAEKAEWIKERGELKAKIERLEKTVLSLEKKIDELIKEKNEKEK